jgi:hypothetical protein
LQTPRDVAEHPVFDRIVFGAPGRVVRHLQVQPQVVGQVAQLFLEPMLAVAVAPAAVAEQEQPGRKAVVRSS